jgi:hypothetical protein
LPPLALRRISAGNGYTKRNASGVEKLPANAKTVLIVEDFDGTRFVLTVLIRNKRVSCGEGHER